MARRRALEGGIALTTILFAGLAASGCGGGSGHGSGSSSFVVSPSPSPTPSGSIGPSGGTATGPSGATVTVPAGALSSAQTITVTAGSVSLPSGFVSAGPAIQLLPDGLTFLTPVTVQVPVTGSPSGTLSVFHASSNGSTEMLKVLSVTSGLATVQLTHFSVVEVVAPTPSPSPSPSSSPSSPSGPPAGVWDQTSWDNATWQ